MLLCICMECLIKRLVMDPQILSAALLITWSTELNPDKSTPCSPYLMYLLPKYNLTLTASDMYDRMKKNAINKWICNYKIYLLRTTLKL
jgi:hypothetical protein